MISWCTILTFQKYATTLSKKFTSRNVLGLVLWAPQLWQKKHILQNFRHLSWLRLLQLWWPAVGWAGKIILPTTDETNTCLKTVSKNCLRCIFCLGRHVHHTAVTPSASKTAMEAPKLMVYLDIYPVSKCQVPCYESYSSPKKKQLITFY